MAFNEVILPRKIPPEFQFFIKSLKIKIVIIVHSFLGQLCLLCLWQCIQMLFCDCCVRMVLSQIIAKYSQCSGKECVRLCQLALRPGRVAKVVEDHCYIEIVRTVKRFYYLERSTIVR